MYKCKECGAVFESPRTLKEDHGEVFGRCPECDGAVYYDAYDFVCEACGERMVEVKGERWCQNCKLQTKQIGNDAIVKAIRNTGAKMDDVVKVFEDAMNGYTIKSIRDSMILKALTDGMIALAYETGADLKQAFEMVEAWAIGTLE